MVNKKEDNLCSSQLPEREIEIVAQIIMCMDGRRNIFETFKHVIRHPNNELMELLMLSMDLGITENSEDHKRFVELSNKYFVEEVYSYLNSF